MANTGRKKMKPEDLRVNLCVKVKPETMIAIQEIAEERMVSITKVVDWLIHKPKTLEDLKKYKMTEEDWDNLPFNRYGKE